MAYSPNRLEHARSLKDQIVAWRRDLHMHPELGFQEFRTARMVAEALTGMGIEAETGIGKTGVVARIGEGHPVIGIRADMDALPILEENEVPYVSQNPNVMHACGHDAHTAMLLAVAQMLSEIPELERPTGQIRLLFQPSEEQQDEEGKSGAMRMIEDGALEGVDNTVALHVYSMLELGKIKIVSGYAMANADRFTATIYGTGAHGASPHQGTDPIFMLAQWINAVNGIRARRISGLDPAVISIGILRAGNANNVIPAEVYIEGTIRSFSNELRQKLHQELERSFAIVQALGGSYDLDIMMGYDATFNDPAVAQLIESVAQDILGPEALVEAPEPSMGAEDFGYMTAVAPGAMFNLGARFDAMDRPHHTPVFDLDEESSRSVQPCCWRRLSG